MGQDFAEFAESFKKGYPGYSNAPHSDLARDQISDKRFVRHPLEEDREAEGGDHLLPELNATR